jgi:hypothetical protein
VPRTPSRVGPPGTYRLRIHVRGFMTAMLNGDPDEMFEHGAGPVAPQAVAAKSHRMRVADVVARRREPRRPE